MRMTMPERMRMGLLRGVFLSLGLMLALMLPLGELSAATLAQHLAQITGPQP